MLVAAAAESAQHMCAATLCVCLQPKHVVEITPCCVCCVAPLPAGVLWCMSLFSDLTPELWNAATNMLAAPHAAAALQPAALTQIYQVRQISDMPGVCISCPMLPACRCEQRPPCCQCAGQCCHPPGGVAVEGALSLAAHNSVSHCFKHCTCKGSVARPHGSVCQPFLCMCCCCCCRCCPAL